MRSRFPQDGRLRLSADRRVVRARGPLHWEGGDVEFTIAVLIWQHGRIAGVGCSPPAFTRPDEHWRLDVVDPTGERFKGGDAHGKAIAIAGKEQGPAQFLEWDAKLTLVVGGED